MSNYNCNFRFEELNSPEAGDDNASLDKKDGRLVFANWLKITNKS